jgi:hypothetical protein
MDWISQILSALGYGELKRALLFASMTGYKNGRRKAGEDTGKTIDPDADVRGMASIGVRTHALSESTIARAKGGLAFNADKLQQEINALVKGGMSEAEAFGAVMPRVKKLFEESFKDWELERLVRDQYLTATKEGRRSGWQEAGAKWRRWRAHHDGKTGADSKRMDGQIQPIDKPYVDPLTGEKYMIPHMRPNDRCYEEPLFELPETIMRHGQTYAKTAGDELSGRLEGFAESILSGDFEKLIVRYSSDMPEMDVQKA